MAKTKISEYSATAGSNTDINNINLAEGMAPSLVNNAIRQLMAQLKDFQVGTAGDNVTVGGNLAVTGTSAFTGAISAPMTAGTIDGVPIGGTTPAAGAFTTLAASGTTTLAGALVGAATQAAFNTVSTTLNLGGAATALNLGAATGTATVNNTTLAAKAITASTTLAVTGTSTLIGAVTATAGVTGPLTSSSVAITGGSITGITDLAVADGGTGASTAANARSNLSAAASGANSDITSITGLTTPLTIAQGGTTASTAAGARTSLGLVIGTDVLAPNGSAANLTSFPTLNQNTTGNAATVTTNANLTGAVTSVGNAASLGSFTSAQLLGALTDETGTGSAVFATSPTLVTPILGTPTSATLTNATGLPISTGVSGLGTGVATALAVNVGSSGAPLVNGGVLGTPSSGTATNLTGLPISTGVSGLGTGVATALAVNVGSSGAPVVNGGALGTPSGGTATNLTGLPLTTGVTGQLPVANGGTGTATPSIVAGTNVTVTGTWPNQTIAASGGGGGITYTTVKTANYTAANNDGVQTNTTSGAFTVTLPATPSNGNQVFVVDSFNTWGTNNLTIGRNGSTIEGVAQDLVCDITGVSVQCVYNGTTWDIFAQVGGAGGSVVTGPASSTDNAFTRFDGTTGKLIQNSTSATLSDDGTAFFKALSIDGTSNSMVFNSGAKIQLQTPTANANWFFETSGTNLIVSSAQSGLFNIYNGSAATTLGVGGATPSASGSGITFPATQSASTDANTLDDYEEGTWTPSISLNSGTATTYSREAGTYTKTGRMVVCLGRVNPSNGTLGSTNGYVRMTGLPFTVGTREGAGSGGNISNLNSGVSATFAYSTTVDVAFVSGVAQSADYIFVVTYFV